MNAERESDLDEHGCAGCLLTAALVVALILIVFYLLPGPF